ncbi:unnamed protein product, partial [Aphanomyces euteiches]
YAKSAAFDSFYLESNYVPEDLTSRFIDEYDRTLRGDKVTRESDYYVDPSLSGNERIARQVEVSAYETRHYDRLSKTTLANLRSDAIIFLNSALSPLLRSCFSNESDPYLLYQAIRARSKTILNSKSLSLVNSKTSSVRPALMRNHDALPSTPALFSVRVPFFPLSILTFGVHAPFPLPVEADILLFL